MFSDKQFNSGRIIFVKGDEITDDGKKVANILNNFFASVVKNLTIKMNDNHLFDY